jgi:dihydrofolate reductase
VAKLIYSTLASLDGMVEDATGNFQWAAPDEEVAAFVNELERPAGTYIYGRRMYETMTFWQEAALPPEPPSVERDYAEIWRAADKIVYSRTLSSVWTPRTRLEPAFEAEAVRQMKAELGRDISLGGAEIASVALAAGVLDEIRLFLHPVLVGKGKPAVTVGERVTLELLETQSFASGVLYVRYGVRNG